MKGEKRRIDKGREKEKGKESKERCVGCLPSQECFLPDTLEKKLVGHRK